MDAGVRGAPAPDRATHGVKGPIPSSPTSGTTHRLLIVGLNYWPEQTGIAPYTTAMAEHLAHHWETTVVAGMPHYPQWRIPEAYQGRAYVVETRAGVRVVRVRHYVPTRQSALRRGLYEGTFLLSAILGYRPERPSAIIGIVPSLSGGVFAAGLAMRYGVPFGLIVQDLMGRAAQQSGIASGAAVAVIARSVEGAVARRAAAVGIVSEGFRGYFEQLGVAPDRMWHLPNWAHVGAPASTREANRARLGWGPREFVVLHAGNMGLKQALEHVIDAARLVMPGQSSIRFVLMGDGSQRARLEALASGVPAVSFLAPEPAERFVDTLSAADVLLVNERATVTDMSLPSKLTSYFVAGRPIVAAVRPDGATAREVERSGAGIAVPAESPTELFGGIERIAADPELAARLGKAGQAYAEAQLGEKAALERLSRFVDRVAEDRERAWIGQARDVRR